MAGGGRQARIRRALVVGQVAMSMLLLAGAGLFARSLYNLTAVNPGFQVDSLLTFSLDPSLSGYNAGACDGAVRQERPGNDWRGARGPCWSRCPRSAC